VPVTVTVTLPVAVKVHESADAPEPPVTEVGLSVQAVLSLVNATVPVKLFKGEIVIVEVPAVPTTTVTAVGFAEIVKSGAAVTVKATLVEWDSAPLVPVTVTVSEPVVVKVHESVEVPEPPVTVAGVKVHAVLSLVRATSPVKPFNGAIVIVDVPGVPTITETVVGLAVSVKSGVAVTVKVADAVWVSDPLVPVIVTL
jgi:hypothetical protein